MTTNQDPSRADFQAAREALDNMDDYCRMKSGVDPIGPRSVLAAFIDKAEQAARRAPSSELKQAADLATWLWNHHYRQSAPQWEPAETLSGVLSQIDNMVCTLAAPSTPAVAEVPFHHYGLSAEQLQHLLGGCLKPDEIAGADDVQHDRVRELVWWFARLTQGNANPKWTASHACELAYFIATNGINRDIDLEAIRKEAFKEGVNITPEERGTLERIGFATVAQAGSAQAGKEEIITDGPEGWRYSLNKVIREGFTPKAAADGANGLKPLPDATVREIFLRAGFTIKEGQADLKQYVFKAAHDLMDAMMAANRTAADGAGELPLLPDPDVTTLKGGAYFTTDQMREYAHAAIRASKEKP